MGALEKKKRDYMPVSITKREAHYYYPALSETTRAKLSPEDFESELLKILIEAGDLTDGYHATYQGVKHGFKNGTAGGYHHDGSHVLCEIVEPGEGCEDYIRDIVKLNYPDFDVKLYEQERKKQELNERLYFDIIFHPDEYKAIKDNERILKFVFEFSAGDYPEHLLFVTLEDKYIRPFIKIMKSRTRCYREEREENEVSISGEQVQVNVKYEDYLKDTDSSFSRMLASYCDHDVYIFKFEDITAQEAQEFIGKEIDAACTESAFGGTRARYILISSKPRDSLELKDPLLNERVFSAPAYNLIS